MKQSQPSDARQFHSAAAHDLLPSRRGSLAISIGEAAERPRSADVGVMIVSNDGESLKGPTSERDMANGLTVHGAALLSSKVSRQTSRGRFDGGATWRLQLAT
jgi:hypothetical protein